MKLWHIKSAFKQFKNRLKHPLCSISASDWDPMDHHHICLAARLLEQKEFEQVCPYHGKCEIEWDEKCDTCPYMTILDFNIDFTSTVKWIGLIFCNGEGFEPFYVTEEEFDGKNMSTLFRLMNKNV